MNKKDRIPTGIRISVRDKGLELKRKREQLGISLNKMSNDIFGNRYRVNHLSSIEKGDIENVSYAVILLIEEYLKDVEMEKKLEDTHSTINQIASQVGDLYYLENISPVMFWADVVESLDSEGFEIIKRQMKTDPDKV